MAAPTNQRRPTFFWQAALILLPVMVLAVMGWYSLRQDKILAEHDAKERAQAIADDLLPWIWNEIAARSSAETNALSFQVDESWQLVFPSPYAAVPMPKPFDIAQLNIEQTRLWQILQSGDAPAQVYRDFMDTHPPENFAATASYELGLLLARQKKLNEAAELFDRVATQYPDVIGESGLPLRPLAQMKLFQLFPRAKISPQYHWNGGRPINSISEPSFSPATIEHFISLDSVCSNLVCQPTPLTPYLLAKISEQIIPVGEIVRGAAGQDPYEMMVGTDLPETEATIQKWRQIWAVNEIERKLFTAARSCFRNFGGNFASLSTSPTGLGTESKTNQSVTGSTLNSAHIPLPRIFPFPAVELLNYSVPQGSAFRHLDYDWLAVRSDDASTNHSYRCIEKTLLSNKLREAMEMEKQIPEYFAVRAQINPYNLSTPVTFGEDILLWHYVSWANPHSEGGGLKKEFSTNLSSNVLAAAVKSEDGTELMRVNVYLTSPETLYQRQQARAFWFGALIVVSTVAALIGLATAWRAFQRQLQLSEMKSNFVSSVSHELRAPIASVRLMAENLEREKVVEPQKQKEYFAFIVQECRRLTSLIENVLDFSRIEQGRKQYEFEPTDMLALVKQTAALMEPYANEKGVKLETFNLQPSTFNIELNVDGRAIQQALVNLIDNAIKHSPKGEVVGVEVSGAGCQVSGKETPSLTPDTPHLALHITDHGAGIPADEQEKIFERFYRRGSELRRETQGVGIGLSIVKHIVEAHGGRVRVESKVGQGSRFTIELPAKNNETFNIQH